MQVFPMTVNGFTYEAAYPESIVKELFLPFLRRLTAMQKEKGRVLALLAGPPGSGKSSLVAALEALSRQEPSLCPIQALGLDGFHYPQSYILTHEVDGRPMKQVKGSPETFDVDALRAKLDALRQSGAVRFPVYDRRLHDVVPDAVAVTGKVLLLEGNWLLLDEPRWAWLDGYADAAIFLEAEEGDVRERLLSRKMRGGLTREEALAFYQTGDGPNVRRCLASRRPCDETWRLGGA